jgi:hypothetical protein
MQQRQMMMKPMNTMKITTTRRRRRRITSSPMEIAHWHGRSDIEGSIRMTSAGLAFCDLATDRRRIGTRRYPVVSWASVSYCNIQVPGRGLDAALADRRKRILILVIYMF